MKIVILTSSLASGGAERVASTLANAWVNSGNSVTLIPTFSGGGIPFYFLSDLAEVIYLADIVGGGSGVNKRYLARFLALRKLIVERKPDVVVSFLPNVNVAAILSLWGTGVPLIIGERSDPSKQPIGKFWRMACRILYRFSDGITVQTQRVADSIGSIYSGLKNLKVLPNPIPEELAQFRVSSAPEGSRKVLLSMGRLAPEKRVQSIISNFGAVCRNFPEWDLHIYGEGPLSDQLGDFVAQSELSERVFFFGRSSNPWAVMAKANAFVMASAYEGFPNALLEAMAVGLPCVATDCPSGPREITRGGKDALLVGVGNDEELGAALCRVMEDGRFRSSLGAQARDSVWSRYSLPRVLEMWDSVFASVGVTR